MADGPTKALSVPLPYVIRVAVAAAELRLPRASHGGVSEHLRVPLRVWLQQMLAARKRLDPRPRTAARCFGRVGSRDQGRRAHTRGYRDSEQLAGNGSGALQSAIRQAPGRYVMRRGTGEPFVGLLDFLWANPDRHGGPSYHVPGVHEALVAVHGAVYIVGVVQRSDFTRMADS